MSMAGLDTLNVNSRVAMAADDGRSVRLAASRTQTGGRGRGGGSTGVLAARASVGRRALRCCRPPCEPPPLLAAQVHLNEDTLGVGRIAKDVLSETHPSYQAPAAVAASQKA